MKRNAITLKKINSSFLSCEKDTNTILRKLFIETQPYSDLLKRLLIINTKNCLEEDGEFVENVLKEHSLAKIVKEGYIKLSPKIALPEHEEVKSYIIISYDTFTPNEENTYYRDCTITFDIICHIDYWDLGDFRIRPLKIAGYIDGILNECKLSGIGTLNFMGCSELILNKEFAGYSLMYRTVHGNDDKLSALE